MAAGETKDMKHFVTFEGIDGSGKSTISKHVYNRLIADGFDTVLTTEPTDSLVGRFVNQCIKTQSDPFVTSFAFIADRIDHCRIIKQWLDEKKIVICDRYAESTYAYQAAQLEDTIDDPLKWLIELSRDRILIPERTFLFVISPKDALERIQHRDSLIPFERQAFLEKVHKYYLLVCKGRRYKKIDAMQSVETIVDLCYHDIVD
jgi:dTMP kinase